MKKIMLLLVGLFLTSALFAQQKVEIFLGKGVYIEVPIPSNWKKGTSSTGNAKSYYSPNSRFVITLSPEWKQGRTAVQILNDKTKELNKPLKSERNTKKETDMEVVIENTITTVGKKEVGRIRMVVDVFAGRDALYVEIEVPATLTEEEKKMLEQIGNVSVFTK